MPDRTKLHGVHIATLTKKLAKTEELLTEVLGTFTLEEFRAKVRTGDQVYLDTVFAKIGQWGKRFVELFPKVTNDNS